MGPVVTILPRENGPVQARANTVSGRGGGGAPDTQKKKKKSCSTAAG
jgi:hypothetical protein